MQQRAPSAIERLADVPGPGKALLAARDARELASRELDAANEAFRAQAMRVTNRGGILLDREARAAETNALRAHAALRKAAADVKEAERAHAPAVERHMAKHGPESLEILKAALEQAHAAARQVAKAVERAQHGGASPPHGLTMSRRIASELSNIIARLK